MYSPNPGLEYASSNFDIRQRFTATITYALPEKKGFAQMLEGRQLNSIVNIQTGLPWSVLDRTTDVSSTREFTDRWNFSGNPADFSNRGTLAIPWYSGTTNPACLTAYNGAGRANPVNGSNGVPFDNSPATPDVQIANPQIGTGSARSLQLGLKVIF